MTPAPVPATSPPPVVTPAPVVTPPKLMRPTPLVHGWLTTRGARLTLLTVQAQKGARISVRCSGIGCQRSAPAQAAG